MSTEVEGSRTRRATPEAGARPQAERSEALGKHAVEPSPPGQSRGDRRNEAWIMRRRLWELSSLERVRACGRVSRSKAGGPTLRVSDDGNGGRVAGLGGLVSCGSPWACPCCGRKIGARRAEEIREVVEGVHAAGGSTALITLTLRHNAGQSLAQTWDALTYGWSKVTSGKGYMAEVARFGIEGWCRAVEVTRGDEFGWHPHLHVLVAFDTPMSPDMIAALGGLWWARFSRAIGRRGYSAVAAKGGLDARTVTISEDGSGGLGRYLSKIAFEVTAGQGKAGRSGNRSPFEILADGLATGNADDLEAWWEYERTSKKRKQLTWSVGFRDRFTTAPEVSDDEIAAEDLGTDDLIALPAGTWAAIRDRAEQFLTVAEAGGLDAACGWLDVRGLDWNYAKSKPVYRGPRPRTPGASLVAGLHGRDQGLLS